MTDLPTTKGLLNRRVSFAYRVVQFCLLLSLLWKWEFFRGSMEIYDGISVQDDFFPELLRSNTVLVGSFACVIASTILAILVSRSFVRHLMCAFSLIGLTVLCLHQGSYNDATFMTAWWTSLWSWWFVNRMHRDAPDVLLTKAAFLSRCIISMILLGGAAGKWTSEYWSGEVLHDIYFVDRNFWTFNWLRERYDAESLREIATIYSRCVVVIETAFGLTLWAMPARIAAVAAIVLLTSIAVFSNFLLFSVLLSLIGLAAVGLFLVRT